MAAIWRVVTLVAIKVPADSDSPIRVILEVEVVLALPVRRVVERSVVVDERAFEKIGHLDAVLRKRPL
mgnify:CR=1 FL=1